MATTPSFLTTKQVERYIRQNLKFRSAAAGVAELGKNFNSLIAKVLDEAAARSKKLRRKTLLADVVKEACAKHVGKADLDWEEIVGQLKQEAPTELGKISQALTQYLDELSTKKSR